MREKLINCPVCNRKAKWTIYSCEWGVEEEYVDCPVCGYRYGFAYGNYYEEVGNKWFVWDYRMNPITHPMLFKKMNKAMFMARRRWKKYRKGCYAKDCVF